MLQFVALVSDLVQVVVRLPIEGVEETLGLELRQTLLDQVFWLQVLLHAKFKLFLRFFEEDSVCQELILSDAFRHCGGLSLS